MTDTLPVKPAEVVTFELDQRRAKAYAESGYWPDAKSQAQALVKVEAGRELGLPALVAMSELYVIDGKPTLGAGAYAALVKANPRYDYRVLELTDLRCSIAFIEIRTGTVIGESNFTMEDAQRAKLTGKGPWAQYPRNMLFARAMSNGVAWFCPDVTMGRVYYPDEVGADLGAPTVPPIDDVIDVIADEIEWPDPMDEENFDDPSGYEPAEPDS